MTYLQYKSYAFVDPKPIIEILEPEIREWAKKPCKKERMALYKVGTHPGGTINIEGMMCDVKSLVSCM